MAGPVNDGPRRDDVPDHPTDRKRRHRRRWPLYLLGFFVCMIVGLIVLALILPRAVSSQRGTHYLLSFLNSRLRGQVKVQKVDISWAGPLQLQGLALLDPQQRQVLNAEKIVVHDGLLHFARAPMTFGDVDIYQPVTNLYLQENQPPSLVQAVEMRGEPTPTKLPASQPASKAPALKGQITIHHGSVRIVKPDGQELGISDINAKTTLDTLNDVKADLAASLASGGAIRADAHVQNMVNDAGQIDMNQATGRFAAKTDQPVAIDPLASFADQRGITGRADLDLNGTLDRGRILADLKTAVQNFSAARQATATQPAPATRPQPINLTLVGHVETGSDKTDARFNLSGDAGTADARFAYAPTTQPAGISTQAIMDALLTGKQINLPNVTGNVQGDLDLRALADAAPRFLQIREDVRITSGRLQIQDLALRTEPQLAAGGGVRLVDLRATQNGQPIEWQPIALNLNAHVEPNVGLQVEKGQLQSGFAEANVHGNPEDLQGQFQADLARLDQQLRQLIDLGDLRLAGGLQGRFQLARAEANQLNVTSQITANDIQYTSRDQKLDIQQATLNPNGSLVLRDNQLQQAVLKETRINVDRQILATTTAEYNFGPKSWKTNLTIDEAQIPYLLNLARGLGIHALDQYEGYRGEIHLPITASYDPQAGTIVASGDGAIRNLGVDRQTVAETLSLKWQQATYAPNTGRTRLGSATVQTDYLNLVASDVEFQPGENMTLRGKVNASAQVKPTLAAAYALARKQRPPDVAGQFKLASNLQTQGQTIAIVREATVDGLQVGTGKQTVRQEQVRLAYDAQVDNQSNTITIRQVELNSAPLAAQLTGTVSDFRAQELLDLKGQYQANWDQVMPIVYEFSPGMKDTTALHGTSRSPFAVRGPAYQANAQPVFRGLTTDGPAIGWQSGLVYGLELGAAQLKLRLQDSKFILPNTAIPASGGTVNLGATVDFTSKTPLLRIPGRLAMMDNINLNTQIGRQLLSYVNPLFSDVAGMEGKISLLIQDINLPLGEEIKRDGSGRGQFNMQNVRVQPAGAFGLLVQIAGATQTRGRGGQPGQPTPQGRFGGLNELGQATGLPGGAQGPQQLGQPEQTGAVDIRIGNPTFEIRDGRINYDNFTLAFPNGVDMVFSGWVGFDDSVKMYVGVPVTAGLLQVAGVRGPVAQYASVLEGARVDIPIVGTRTSSKLDFADIKVKPLVDQAIRKLAELGIQQGIRTAVPGAGLVPGLVPGGKQPAGQGPSLPGEDIIKDIIPGQKNQQQQQQQPQDQQQQQQQHQQQQQPQHGLPGEGILHDILPGHK